MDKEEISLTDLILPDAGDLCRGIVSMLYAQEQNLLALVRADNPNIIELRHNAEKIWLEGHEQAITALALNKDESLLVSCAFDQKIIIWDLNRQKIIQILESINLPVALAFSPSEPYLMVGRWASHIDVWDWQKGKKIKSLKFSIHNIKKIRFSPDGQYFISTHHKELQLWSAKSLMLLKKFSIVEDTLSVPIEINDVVFCEDSRHFFTIEGTDLLQQEISPRSHHSILRYWDLEQDYYLKKSQFNAYVIMCITVFNGIMALGNYDGSVMLINQKKLKLLETFCDSSVPVNCLTFVDEGNALMIARIDNTLSKKAITKSRKNLKKLLVSNNKNVQVVKNQQNEPSSFSFKYFFFAILGLFIMFGGFYLKAGPNDPMILVSVLGAFIFCGSIINSLKQK